MVLTFVFRRSSSCPKPPKAKTRIKTVHFLFSVKTVKNYSDNDLSLSCIRFLNMPFLPQYGHFSRLAVGV